MTNELTAQKLLEGKKICIFGGLGSIGTDIVAGLLKFNPSEIIVADNRETELFYSKEYPIDKRIRSEFVDIRNYDSVENALEGVDVVFHAAAMKHVIICEDAPFEAVKTNVIGTHNIIEACIKRNVKKMILISTDKAVNPTNVMGATKLLAEKMVAAVATSKRKNGTDFGIVRFGNVLYSRGSVLEIWNKQISEGKKVTLTNENMTRFFMSTKECVELIFEAARISKNGEIFVLKMPTIRMGDLLNAFLEIKGLDKNTIQSIDVRKGEKMHEELLIGDESSIVLENSKLFINLPPYISSQRVEELKKIGFKESSSKIFSSNKDNILNVDDIKRTLEKENKF